MPDSRTAQVSGGVFSPAVSRPEVDLDLACVVGASRVNRIVATSIAQRTGLKVVDQTPENAGDEIAERSPCLVILDGGADNLECEGVMDILASQRRVAEGSLPFVILLTNTLQPDMPVAGSVVDAIVAKPITPERLQPVIQSFLDRVRD